MVPYGPTPVFETPPTGGLSDYVHGLGVAERAARGRAARKTRARRDLGIVADLQRDPCAILSAQEQVRVPNLVSLRHQRMGADPFAFLRGSAAVMAADLRSQPTTGLMTQLCGDAHLANLGMFAGPDRRIIFDINDFDETAPGPFEWDVLRLATSFAVAATATGHQRALATELPAIVATAYQQAMAMFSSMNDLDVWYYRIDTDLMRRWAREWASGKAAERAVTESEAQARSRDRWSAVRSLTYLDGDRRRFKSRPPLLTPLEADPEVRSVVGMMFHAYRSTLQPDRRELLGRYFVIDVGHKVVGVGSVGLLAFVLLLQGRDDDDLLVLQVKQAVDSVLDDPVGAMGGHEHGKRVVVGQQLMQAASDSFLGWVDGPRGRSFYVRQLRDMKQSADLTTMRPDGYRAYARLCGMALARAHARAGDSVAIAAYLGSSTAFAKGVTAFALEYAERNDEDYRAFRAGVADGRLVKPSGDGILPHLRVEEDGSVLLSTPIG